MTEGAPSVTDVGRAGRGQERLLELAVSVEGRLSTARACRVRLRLRAKVPLLVEDFGRFGEGALRSWTTTLARGNLRMMEGAASDGHVRRGRRAAGRRGQDALFFAQDGELWASSPWPTR
ncbi:MAG: hypothetical protein ACLSVD_14790 [Eggerthellaceae bacterium]